MKGRAGKTVAHTQHGQLEPDPRTHRMGEGDCESDGEAPASEIDAGWMREVAWRRGSRDAGWMLWRGRRGCDAQT